MEKTPIQQAIETLRTKIYGESSDTDEAWNNGVKKSIYILESLLPTEESFAKECFNAGRSFNPPTIKGNFSSGGMVTFKQHYSQYKPPQQ